jgi:hypothetical protein
MLSKLVQAATITFALHLLMGMDFPEIEQSTARPVHPILSTITLPQ